MRPGFGRPNETGEDPCPWCQSRNCKVQTIEQNNGRLTKMFVGCTNCGAKGPFTLGVTNDLDDMANAKRMALNHWNGGWKYNRPTEETKA